MQLLRPVRAALICLSLVAASLPAQTAHAAQEESAPQQVPDMLEKALPAVVTIGVYREAEANAAFGFAGSPVDSAYEREPDLSGAASTGSGFIILRGGKKYVVTNAHVINSAGPESGSIAAHSINGGRYDVRVVGADSLYDIAVLEFAAPPGPELATLEFRPDDIRIGETVFALGNPLGDFPYSVTQGIIGGKNRVRDGLTGKFGYLQSSAVTTWGNSGGPLVDRAGRVVGINSQIHTVERPFGTVVEQQLNFALESPLARRAVDDIIAQGRVRRAYLGVIFAQRQPGSGPVTLKGEPRIAAVLKDGPAAASLAGREGSLVTAVNGAPVRNVQELLGELEKLRPGDTVALTLEGKSQAPRFPSGELTPLAHARLARAFLRRFASWDLDERQRGAVLTPARDCGATPDSDGVCGTWASVYDATPSGKNKKVKEGFGSFRISSAGVIDNLKKEQFILWQVPDAAQLGIALRLAAITGKFSLTGTMDGAKAALSVVLSDGNELLRPLLY